MAEQGLTAIQSEHSLPMDAQLLGGFSLHDRSRLSGRASGLSTRRYLGSQREEPGGSGLFFDTLVIEIGGEKTTAADESTPSCLTMGSIGPRMDDMNHHLETASRRLQI